jgi:hypothetical protein
VGGHLRLGANARRGLNGPAAAGVEVAGYVVGLMLAGVAALRRGKAVHPHGIVFDAELVVGRVAAGVERAELFATEGRRPALVRFSRSLGVPRPLPDLLGMSVRVPDAYGPGRHQDFLMVTSFDAPVAHHVFVPARDAQRHPYSSSLPYRVGDRTLLVGALPRRDSPRPHGGNELERLSAAAATGRLAFELAVAELWGRFEPVAELRVGAPLSRHADALRFNPWNTGGGLQPAGVLNRLRDYAYPLSQKAWALTGGAGEQAAAEAAVQRGPRA